MNKTQSGKEMKLNNGAILFLVPRKRSIWGRRNDTQRIYNKKINMENFDLKTFLAEGKMLKENITPRGANFMSKTPMFKVEIDINVRSAG
jgi:hypothetical protein